MTRPKPKILTRDWDALDSASHSEDELTSALAKLFKSFGDEVVIMRAAELYEQVWKPERETKKAGAKDKWGGGNKLYAWIAIERCWRMRKAHDPNVKLTTAIEEKFRQLRKKPGVPSWNLGTDIRTGKPLLLRTAETARKYHRDAEKILAGLSPQRRQYWRDFADNRMDRWIAAGKKLVPKAPLK